jgi:hypothetical protein
MRRHADCEVRGHQQQAEARLPGKAVLIDGLPELDANPVQPA